MGNANKIEHSSENESKTNQNVLCCRCLTCKKLKEMLQKKKQEIDYSITQVRNALKKLKQRTTTTNIDVGNDNKILISLSPLLKTAGFLFTDTNDAAFCMLCNTNFVINSEHKQCPWLFHISKKCKIAEYASKIIELLEGQHETHLSYSFYRYYTFQRETNFQETTNTETPKRLKKYAPDKIYKMAEAGFYRKDNDQIECFKCNSELLSEDVWHEHVSNEKLCDFAAEYMPEKLLYNIEYANRIDNRTVNKFNISMFARMRQEFNACIKARNKYDATNYGTFFKKFENEKVGVLDSNFLLFSVTLDEERNQVEKQIKQQIKQFYLDSFNNNEQQQLYTTCLTIIDTNTDNTFCSENMKKRDEVLIEFFEMLKQFHQLFNDQYGGMILITNGIRTRLTDSIKTIMTFNSTRRSKNTVWHSKIAKLYVRLLGVTNYNAVENILPKIPEEAEEKKYLKRTQLDNETQLSPFVTDFIFIEEQTKMKEINSSMPTYQDFTYNTFSEKSVSLVLILGHNIERFETLVNNLSEKDNDTFHNIIILCDNKISENMKKAYQTNKKTIKLTFISLEDNNFRATLIQCFFEIFCLGCKEQLLQLSLLGEDQIETFKNIIKRSYSERKVLSSGKVIKCLNVNSPHILINQQFMRYEKLKELLRYKSVISPCADFTTLTENFFQMMLFWAVLTDKHVAAEFFFKCCGQKIAVASALVASHLYKLKINKNHISNTTLKNNLKQFSIKYTDKAINIINERYLIKGENKKVLQMLKQKHEQIRGINCMEIAGIINCGKFLDTEACRNAMDYEWHKHSAGSFIKFIISLMLMLGVLLKKLIKKVQKFKKRKESENPTKKINDAQEKKLEEEEKNLKIEHKEEHEEITKASGKCLPKLPANVSKNEAEKFEKNESCKNKCTNNTWNKNVNANGEFLKTEIDNWEICLYYWNKFGNWVYQTYSEELNANNFSRKLCNEFVNNKKYEEDKKIQLIKDNETSINIIKFLKAPISKFSLNLICYTAFLVYYIIIVLTIKNNQWSSYEYFIFIWFLTFSIEEVYEIAKVDGLILEKLLGHIAISVFNASDVIIILFGLITFFLRIFSLIEAAMYFYWLNGVLLIIRLFRELAAFRSIGPKLVMISIMLRKLIHFFVVAFILLTIFSFTSSIFSTSFLSFFKSYFVVGQLLYDFDNDFAQPLEDCQTSFNESAFINSTSCASVTVPIYITTICFIYLVNILLINFLIALFNDVYNKYSVKSNEIWRLSLFSLIEEYKRRPIAPPPFCAIEILLRGLYYLFQTYIIKFLVSQYRTHKRYVLSRHNETPENNADKRETKKAINHNSNDNSNMTDESQDESDMENNYLRTITETYFFRKQHARTVSEGHMKTPENNAGKCETKKTIDLNSNDNSNAKDESQDESDKQNNQLRMITETYFFRKQLAQTVLNAHNETPENSASKCETKKAINHNSNDNSNVKDESQDESDMENNNLRKINEPYFFRKQLPQT